MTAKIAEWFFEIFKNEYLTTFIISMIPMIEVRGAIPIAVGMGMNIWIAYLFSCLSALVVCPILVLIFRPILDRLKRTKLFKSIAGAVEDTFKTKAKKIEDKADKKSKSKVLLYKIIGLYAFVAIPLPMTGVWTGTCIAVFLNMKLKHSLPAVVVGNFTAGAIITLLTVLLGDKSSIILLVLAIFVIISLAGLVVGIFMKKKKADRVLAENTASPNTVAEENITDKKE